MINYIPLGDSLTAGHGLKSNQSWPALLTNQLEQQSLAIKLTQNLARSGSTSKQILLQQVPAFIKLKPSFTTLLAGANDLAQGVNLSDFKSNLEAIITAALKVLPTSTRLAILTIPDFSTSPAATKYSGHLHVEPLIRAYNQQIENLAQTYQLAFIDLFAFTKRLGSDSALYLPDGIHPSAAGYVIWESEIRKKVIGLLIEST